MTKAVVVEIGTDTVEEEVVKDMVEEEIEAEEEMGEEIMAGDQLVHYF